MAAAAAAALPTLKITLKYTHEEMERLLPGRFQQKFPLLLLQCFSLLFFSNVFVHHADDYPLFIAVAVGVCVSLVQHDFTLSLSATFFFFLFSTFLQAEDVSIPGGFL